MSLRRIDIETPRPHASTMPRKSEQLQIRVSPQEKAELKARADAAGMDLSRFVLEQALPSARVQFAQLVAALSESPDHRYELAELNDWLTACPADTFSSAVETIALDTLIPFLQNYVAAMVELAATLKHATAPAWTRDVIPLDVPYFATRLTGLRMHLLRSAPVPFKRRNLFVDASIGDRA